MNSHLDLDDSRTNEPRQVTDALLIVRILLVYFTCFGPLLILVGLFVGPTILAVGALHGLAAVAFWILRRNLNHRRNWARFGLIMSAVSGLVGTVIAVGSLWASRENFGAFIVPIALSLLLAMLLRALISSAARDWCNRVS